MFVVVMVLHAITKTETESRILSFETALVPDLPFANWDSGSLSLNDGQKKPWGPHRGSALVDFCFHLVHMHLIKPGKILWYLDIMVGRSLVTCHQRTDHA